MANTLFKFRSIWITSSNSSTHLARRQSAPRPENIRILTDQSKIYLELKNITDTALVQVKKVQQKANAEHLFALRRTHATLLKYKREGLEVSDALLRIVEDVLSPHRRFNDG
jgi:hypothetical protein